MSEHIDSGDYTYDAPHLELVRPDELAAARKRIAELEAKLDAVPVEAIRFVHFGNVYQPGYMDACSSVGDWLIELAYAGTQTEVQP